MDAIEKRARELLASRYDMAGKIRDARDIRAGDSDTEEALAVGAIIAALTPPEGWVLMPVETTAEMLDDAYAAFPGFAGEDQIDAVYAALIAARPEVPGA